MEQIEKLKAALSQAEVVLIGAGAGLSTSAGFTYSGERFEKYFGDFIAKYGFTDMYSAGFPAESSLSKYRGDRMWNNRFHLLYRLFHSVR